MATTLISILALAAFGITFLVRKNKNTPFYMVFCIFAFAWFIAMTIIKAKAGPLHIAVLFGFLAAWMLWRIVSLATRSRRAQNQTKLS